MGKKRELLSLGARLCSSALGSCVMLGAFLRLLELVNLICEVVIKVSVSELSAQNSGR